MSLSRALGLALGYAADQAFGDPRSYHPVAGFGRLAAALEERTYINSRTAGVGHVALLVGGTVTVGWVLESIIGKHEWVRVLTTAAGTWAVLGGRSLVREADILSSQLSDNDLVAARRQIRNLVGRDPSALNADELARACVESVAENTSDAVVAPLFWGALLGLPGLLGYRAVNTLDAMIGHRSPRYERFGWAAALLDDVANWLPARLAGALAAVTAPLVGGSPSAAVRAVVRDSGRHPSPNAGVVEAAFAGALGVRLGGVNVYHGEVEDRGELGDGRHIEVGDIARTARLSRLVSVGSLAVAVAFGARAERRTTVSLALAGSGVPARTLTEPVAGTEDLSRLPDDVPLLTLAMDGFGLGESGSWTRIVIPLGSSTGRSASDRSVEVLCAALSDSGWRVRG